MNKLTVQAFSGFLKLLMVLALFIFLPAGTFRYWQGWIFLFFFLACAAAVTFYFIKRDPKLIESRLQAGPVAEQERAQKIIQTLASLCFALSLIIPGLDYRLGWSRVPLPLVWAGDALVFLGYGVIFRVFKENTYAASTVKVRKKQKVISAGPYTWVRHPMYAGALGLLAGMPLALGSFWGLIPVAGLYAVIIVRLLAEEKFLSKKLPGYKAYCRKTPYRLAPYIW